MLKLRLLCAGLALALTAMAQTAYLVEGDGRAIRAAVSAAGGEILPAHPSQPANYTLVRIADEQRTQVPGRVYQAIPELFDRSRPVYFCGSDVTNPPAISSGWYWQGVGPIGYSFGNMQPDFGYSADFYKSVARWVNDMYSSVIEQDYYETADPNAWRSLHIAFMPDDHGDSPFDNALAHNFYPYPGAPESLAGDMHIKKTGKRWDFRPWVSPPDVGVIDAASVMLHEGGHARGLAHRDSGLMHPIYQGIRTFDSGMLSDLWTAYGMRSRPLPAPPVEPGTPAPEPCRRDCPPTPGGATLTLTAPSSVPDSTVTVQASWTGTGATVLHWVSMPGGYSGDLAVTGTTWQFPVALSAGANTVTVDARNASGATLASASATVTYQSGRSGR